MAYTNAIFYIDLVSGSDAVRSTLSSCTASNPSGTITRINKTGHGLVTGAVVTLSNFTAWLNGVWKITWVDADNFDLDTAVWQATADASGDCVPFGGSSWADAWLTITSGATAARIAPGDIIRISKTADPVSIGNATWTDASKTVTLATAQTATVDNCETAWTANGSGDCTVTRIAVATDAKEGSYCMKFALDAAVQTSVMQAYYQITETDFSAYQRLSFWIKNEVAIADAASWKICLCSDTAGATIVDTFWVPAIASTARWIPVTVTRSGGGNCGASIKSVAIWTGTTAPTASKYIYLDNIIACTTSGLNLQSLISKNGSAQGGTEGFYAIQSISGTTIILDGGENTKSNATWMAYAGTTETIETYIRTTTITYDNTAKYTINDSGTSISLIEYQGGYEVGTTNQNGETFLSGNNCNVSGLILSGRTWNKFNFISFSRFTYGINASYSGYNYYYNINSVNNCAVYGISYDYYSLNDYYDLIISCCNNASDNIIFNRSASGNVFNRIINCSYAAAYGISFLTVYFNNFKKIDILDGCVTGAIRVQQSFENKLHIVSSTGTSPGILQVNTYVGGSTYLINSTFNRTTDVSPQIYYLVYLLNHDGTTGNNIYYYYSSYIAWQTSVCYGSETGAWCATFGPANDSFVPAKFKIAEVAVVSGSLVTVTTHVKKAGISNISTSLNTPENIALGITETNDVKADDTDWEELSVSFTPTADGVAEIYITGYYVSTGSSSCYIGSITVTQA